jgi:hypothetical protein
MRSSLRRTHKSQLARVGVAVAGLLAASTLTTAAGAPAQARVRVPAPLPATTTTVASFNVLGSSHTRNSSRYQTGVERMRYTVRLLQRHDVEVVGFQEMQGDQLRSFLDRTQGSYAVYSPRRVGAQGRELRRTDTDNTIAWDTTEWQEVPGSRTYLLIPYFDGHPRAMPEIKLQNRLTGMTAWFANFHTPATNRQHRNSDPYRAEAIRRIAAEAVRLKRDGSPLIFTGDMNERAEVFCAMTGDAPMRAARGGSNRNGVCDPMHPWYVDWIFGMKRQRFSNYVEDRGALDRRTSDHPMIVADARLDPAKFPTATRVVPAPVPTPTR